MNPSFSLEHHVAIITGGADGLGLALAHRLSAFGARVELFDLNAQKLPAARASLGERCGTHALDVTDADVVHSAVDKIATEQQRIDILVNCAGITGQTNQKSHEIDVADFDRVFAINVRGTFIACQAVLPHMLRRNYGRILNIASIAGKEGNAGMVSYSSSKAAIIGMTKSMGKEYAETGITVNALAPAVIRTELVNQMPPEQVKYMTDKIPMRRCGTLSEFAATAHFIVSPETSYSTGFTFDLSGGRATY
jgi:3-oxoacyl-[acyl-carrier protein] reductase